MTLRKGEIIEIEIKKIVYGGEGLGFYEDNFAIFVPMSVPGDILEVEIISLKKTYGRGLIKKIVKPSIERVKNTDSITFEDFQGCNFGMLEYKAQLKYKQEMVEDVIRKIGKNSEIKIEEILESEVETNYRNKVIEPFALKNGEIITGFFKRKSHDVFEVEDNILNSVLGNQIIKELKILLNKSKISVYDEKTHRGVLRHIMIRTNSYGDAMVVLVVNDKKVNDNIKNILLELKNKNDNIKSVYVSLNDVKTNVAIGERNILISGEATIKESISNIDFNISPTSFFQINVVQTRRLYELATSMFEDIDKKVVVDAYSGTGTLGMILSRKAKQVYCIEIVKEAVEDGIKTAKENKIENVEFIAGDVTKELSKLIKIKKIDSLILDPPRKGLEKETLLNIAESGIKEIVYISCDPGTFARDANILEENGYVMTRVKPVDMFPQTSHIECVARFSAKNS